MVTAISYVKQIVLILTIGMSIGFLIPMVMLHMPVSKNQGLNQDTEISNLQVGGNLEAKTHDEMEFLIPNDKYYVFVDEGVLSVVQGNPQSSNVILTEIDIRDWPQDMQNLITQREYHSLDEIQSFIDSMSEELRSK